MEKRAGSYTVVAHFRAHGLGCPHEATVPSRNNVPRLNPKNAIVLPSLQIPHASRLVNTSQALEVAFSCQLSPNILLTAWLLALHHERLAHRPSESVQIDQKAPQCTRFMSVVVRESNDVVIQTTPGCDFGHLITNREQEVIVFEDVANKVCSEHAHITIVSSIRGVL